jgi:hypothetical protein
MHISIWTVVDSQLLKKNKGKKKVDAQYIET